MSATPPPPVCDLDPTQGVCPLPGLSNVPWPPTPLERLHGMFDGLVHGLLALTGGWVQLVCWWMAAWFVVRCVSGAVGLVLEGPARKLTGLECAERYAHHMGQLRAQGLLPALTHVTKRTTALQWGDELQWTRGRTYVVAGLPYYGDGYPLDGTLYVPVEGEDEPLGITRDTVRVVLPARSTTRMLED